MMWIVGHVTILVRLHFGDIFRTHWSSMAMEPGMTFTICESWAAFWPDTRARRTMDTDVTQATNQLQPVKRWYTLPPCGHIWNRRVCLLLLHAQEVRDSSQQSHLLMETHSHRRGFTPSLYPEAGIPTGQFPPGAPRAPPQGHRALQAYWEAVGFVVFSWICIQFPSWAKPPNAFRALFFFHQPHQNL